MKRFSSISIIAIAALLSMSSCKKDKKTDPEPEPTPTPTYSIPTTYNFTSADLKSSTQRLSMFRELISYIRTTHTATAHVTINSANMQNMYQNSGSPFVDAGGLGLNASGISLKEKTNNIISGMVNELEAIFVEAAATSQSTVGASDGVAGKLLGPAPTTTNGTQAAYLVNAKGFEYKELVEKGGMGAILYSEAMAILKDIGTLDNTTLVNGLTAQERAWDEAFGYFGVPVAFPTTTTGLLYWGSYCNSVNSAIGSNQTIMDAWLKGRAAITNKDNASRDAARDIVMATWEKIGAARFITYVKQAKTNLSNDGARNHSLSEGVGFIRAFKYNPSKKITDAEINELMGYIGNNLYQVLDTDLTTAITRMAAIFGLDQSKL
jgi:hypothetical protein